MVFHVLDDTAVSIYSGSENSFDSSNIPSDPESDWDLKNEYRTK